MSTLCSLPLMALIESEKSSLASWVSWQFGVPTVHLDLYTSPGEPLGWRTADLESAVERQLMHGRSLVVEGVFVLDALKQIGYGADFLVEVGGEPTSSLMERITGYRSRWASRLPDFTMDGFDRERAEPTPMDQPPA
jgi:hypothetical protein